MNETIKYLLPHIYMMLGFAVAFLGVEQSIPFNSRFDVYAALIWWLFIFAFVLLHNQERLPIKFVLKKDKWFLIERTHNRDD